MTKYILILILLLGSGCATTGGKNETPNLGECQENGILADQENPELVNCSEIKLFISNQKKLEWNENTYKAKLVKQKDLEVYFLYSNDGRYYVLVSGQKFNLPQAEGTLTINSDGDVPEHISLAAEDRFLSGTGLQRSGNTLFKLTLKVPKDDLSSYEAKFKFELNL